MTLKNIWAWLVTSSADPTRYSLALKGVLVLLVPKLLAGLSIACSVGLWCTNIDASWFGMVIDFLVKAAEMGLYLIGGAMTLWGLGRKIYNVRWSHPDA